MEEDEEEFPNFLNNWVGRPNRELMMAMRGDPHMHRFIMHEHEFNERYRGRDRNHERHRESEENENEREQLKEVDEKDNKIYFIDLINFPKKLYENKKDIDTENNILPLKEFKQEKINKLKEDIFYYCAEPEILSKLNNNVDDEKRYKIYKDLNTKNFLFSLKIKNMILNDKETKLKSLTKQRKLSNYIKDLPKKLIKNDLNEQEKEEQRLQIGNLHLISNKIDEIFSCYKEKENEEILNDIKELEKLISENKVNIKYIGFVTYNLLESNLCTLLESIINKFDRIENNENILKNLSSILFSINEKFKSVKLLFILIKFCSSNLQILESSELDKILLNQFISKDSLNIDKLFKKKNLKNQIKIDLGLYWDKKEIKDRIKNINNTNFNEYITLHYEDNLFVFFNTKNKNIDLNMNEKQEIKEESPNILYFLKLNLSEKNVIDYGKIELIQEKDIKEEKIIDINISIKNEFIYIFYLSEKLNEEKYLKYIIYNQSTMGLIKEGFINFKDYSCNNLLNDNKYLYCICEKENSYKVLVIQKKIKLDFQKYSNLNIYMDKEHIKDKNFIYTMHNCLSINNLLILEKNYEKYIAYFVIKNKDEYELYISKLNNNSIDVNDIESKNIKLSFNNNRFLLTKYNKEGFIFNISQKDNNNLINEGITLLPFDYSNNIDNFYANNIYECLLQKYSNYLNLYGNFDLLTLETEKNLLEDNFIYSYNFKEYILNFVIKKIMEKNKEEDLNIKYYYFIILKQIICAMHNSGIFDEKKIKYFFDYLKEFIFENIKNKENIRTFNKILKEIIYIITYTNNGSIIDVKDVENEIEKDINRTKILLIELLLEQKSTQKSDNLLSLIIKFDKIYLINTFNSILKESNKEILLYSLYKHMIDKYFEILFSMHFSEDIKLKNLKQYISLLNQNIKDIFILYTKSVNNKFIKEYSPIYNSFNFKLFYFIIQTIISKKIYIENDIKESIQDILLFLDKYHINDNIYEYLDMNSVHEIKISSLMNINGNYEISYEDNRNIIFRTSYITDKNIDKLIRVSVLYNNNEQYNVNFYNDTDVIFRNIKKVYINYINKSEIKNEIIIDIIPLKDEENFIKYQKNKDNKMIDLIEKSLIVCLLNMYDEIQELISKYNNNKLILNHAKIYQNEILKFFDLNKEELKDENRIKSVLIEKSDALIENIKNIMEDEFDVFINPIKNIKEETIEKKDEDKKINKLIKDIIDFFEEYYLNHKNNNLRKTKSYEKVKSLIKKIFTIGIKYNKYNDKLEKLIENISIKTKNSVEKNEKEIESLENFKDIYFLFITSLKMSQIYDLERNNFIAEEFDKEVDKYIKNTSKKLDFIDKVLSSKNQKENNISPNKSFIIDNIFSLLKELENFEEQEIIKYSEIQNINANFILKKFELIYNLLKEIKKEKNLSFFLCLMNQKIRMNYHEGKMIFDNIYGASFILMENLKNKFHDIIKILYEKNKKNNFSYITKYVLLECLLWKIKERDFDLILEIITIFENIIYLNEKDNNKLNCLDIYSYNIIYFDFLNEYKRKKEIFEILISQILYLGKENVKLQNEERYQILIKRILYYFEKINVDNPYYHEFILLFYKNIFNSNKMFDLILSSENKIIEKILEISLTDNSIIKDNENRNIYTKLIMMKLLYQILNLSDKEKIKTLSNIKLIEDTYNKNINIFEHLFKLFYSKLNKNKNDGKIIKKYYQILSIVCLNKLLEEKNGADIVKQSIQSGMNILSILFFDYIGIIQNRYIINTTQEIIFENNALYNSENENNLQTGKILCFLDNKNSLEEYLLNDSDINFDKNKFKFFTETNKIEEKEFYGLVLSDDALNSEFFKINKIEYLNKITIQECNENNLQKYFNRNNSKIIINIIIKQFSSLNDKGIYFALEMINHIINQLDKEDISNIYGLIYEYYLKKKYIENKFKFLSLEFIKEKLNIILSEYMSNNKNIYKDEEKKNISDLFNFCIIENSLGISLKSSNNIKMYNQALKNPIENEEQKEIIKNIYKNINVEYISFNHDDNYKECILFVNSLQKDDLKFTDNDEKKIKAIISKDIINIEEKDLCDFIKEKNIPIYLISKNVYSKFENFFLKEIGGNYININTLDSKMENSSAIVNIFQLEDLFYKTYEENNEEKNGYNCGKKYEELVTNMLDFYCLINIKIIKRLIFEILCLDSSKKENVEIDDEIITILELLNLEYYFNIKNNISNKNLKQKLIKYMKQFYNEWIKKYFDIYIDIKFENSLNYKYFLELFDIKENHNEKELSQNFFKNYNNLVYDKLLFLLKNCINNSYIDESIIYNYLKLVKIILENKLKSVKKWGNRYYDESSDEEDIRKIKDINDNFPEIFLFETFKSLYKYIINNGNDKLKIFKKCFEESNIDNTIKKYIEQKIDLDDYFDERMKKKIKKKEILIFQMIFIYFDFCLILFFRENEDKYLKSWIKGRNRLFIFYCDYKLLSIEKYYNENDFREIFSLIAQTSDSIDCFNNRNISNKSSDKDIFEMNFKESNNGFYKYIKDINGEETITSFSVDKTLKTEYNKVIIFIKDCSDEEKYILQEIIDINELKRKNIDFKIKLMNNEIYLVPINNIKTYLYAFGNNYNNSLGISGNLSTFYDEPKKCNGLSKYSWNIAYGQNYCLVLDELDNKIYSCGQGKWVGLSSISKKNFIEVEGKNINAENFEKEKIIELSSGNCTTSMILTQSGNIYAIGNNDSDFLSLKNSDITSIKIPKLLNNIKIISMSIGYKNSFIIDSYGALYGMGDNNRHQIDNDSDGIIKDWTKIELPEGGRRFLQCVNGDRYLICLVEDYKGNGKLYARGINKNFECGIKTIDSTTISSLTPCDDVQGINFKYIYTRNNRSAAISTKGELYIWGKKIDCNYIKPNKDSDDEDDNNEEKNEDIKCPTLITELKKIIIDQVAISNTHLLAIGRNLDKNGNYVKNLFSCGNNKKGALGQKIHSFSDINIKKELIKVEIKDKTENVKLVPIKISIGNHRSFVLCINENELIKEIKDNKINNIFQIKIRNYLEESMENKLKDFYKSDEKFRKFENIFRALTHKNYLDFVDIIDKIKIDDRILTSNIYYNEFLNYLNRQKNIYDFLMIFGLGEPKEKVNEQESESIFNYLKTRMILAENNIMKYCMINNRSEYKKFLQKIITNNILYLPNKIRLQKFNEFLSEIRRDNHELKTIKVDRFKAKAFYDKYNESYKKIKDFDLDETIFGQIFHLLKDKDSKEFFLEKNSRLFRVALKDEHASDSGGPYHEVISNICEELQSDYLDLFIKTPNNRNNYDLLNDKYIINPNSNGNLYNEAYEFIGKLMASSISTGEALDLNFHPIIWKSILGNDISFYDYESIDYYFYNYINKLEYIYYIKNIRKKQEEFEYYGELFFVIKNSNNIDIELKYNGSKIKVALDNLKEYIELCKSLRIKEFQNSLEYLKKGFYSVISYDILQVLTWQQLDEMICGENKLDIDKFKAHTEYEGYNKNDNNIIWFWEWLEAANQKEKIKYLKFVSGRSRLPKSENGFKYKHIISKAVYSEKNGFPKSMTCFFKLNLPEYDSKEILFEKMKYAIIYCYEIDTDQ